MPDVNLGADLELKGLNQFLTGLRKVQGEGKKARKGLSFKGAAKRMRGLGGAAKRVGRTIKGLGKIASGFTLGLAGGLGVALGKFGEFELQMARVGTLLEPGRKGMDEFGASVNRASVQFAQDAGVMADAVFQAISAGVDSSTDSVNEFSQVVGTAAVGGFVDAATVVDGLTTVMNAFGKEAGTASEISDKFFIANKLGKTTFEELSRSIGKVAPTAKALGVSFEEVLAATVSLTKGGIKTNEVMSGLKAVFGSIKVASEDAQKVAKDLGIDFSLQGLKAKGLAGFMADLTEKTKGNTIAQAELFGSIEAFNAVARLASQEGAKDFTESLDRMKKAGGESAEAMGRVASTTGFKLKQIKQGFSRFTREIGAGLAEGFGINEITNIPDAIEEASVTLRSAAGSFASSFRSAFAPAAAFGEMDLTGMAKSMGKAVAELANGFISMLRALPSVVAGIGEVVKGLSVALGFVNALMKIGAPTQVEQAAEAAKRGGGGLIIEGPASVSMTKKAIKGGFGKDIQKKVMRAIIRQGDVKTAGAFEHGQVVAARLISAQSRERIAVSNEKQRLREVRERMKAGRMATDAAGNVLAETNAPRFTPGSEGTRAAALGGPNPNAVMSIDLDLTTNVENNFDGAKDKKTKRFGARGRGGGSIETTVRSRYIVFEGRIAPISDRFIFSSLVDQTAV